MESQYIGFPACLPSKCKKRRRASGTEILVEREQQALELGEDFALSFGDHFATVNRHKSWPSSPAPAILCPTTPSTPGSSISPLQPSFASARSLRLGKLLHEQHSAWELETPLPPELSAFRRGVKHLNRAGLAALSKELDEQETIIKHLMNEHRLQFLAHFSNMGAEREGANRLGAPEADWVIQPRVQNVLTGQQRPTADQRHVPRTTPNETNLTASPSSREEATARALGAVEGQHGSPISSQLLGAGEYERQWFEVCPTATAADDSQPQRRRRRVLGTRIAPKSRQQSAKDAAAATAANVAISSAAALKDSVAHVGGLDKPNSKDWALCNVGWREPTTTTINNDNHWDESHSQGSPDSMDSELAALRLQPELSENLLTKLTDHSAKRSSALPGPTQQQQQQQHRRGEYGNSGCGSVDCGGGGGGAGSGSYKYGGVGAYAGVSTACASAATTFFGAVNTSLRSSGARPPPPLAPPPPMPPSTQRLNGVTRTSNAGNRGPAAKSAQCTFEGLLKAEDGAAAGATVRSRASTGAVPGRPGNKAVKRTMIPPPPPRHLPYTAALRRPPTPQVGI